MIDAILSWSESNVKEYVKYTIFSKNKNTKLYMILYALFMFIIAVGSVITAIATGMMWLLFAFVCAVILIVFFGLILVYSIKKYTADIIEINKGSTMDGIEITSTCLALKKEGVVTAKLGWENLISADFYGDYVFFNTVEGFLIIIGKNDIKKGSISELKEIVDEKLVKQVD